MSVVPTVTSSITETRQAVNDTINISKPNAKKSIKIQDEDVIDNVDYGNVSSNPLIDSAESRIRNTTYEDIFGEHEDDEYNDYTDGYGRNTQHINSNDYQIGTTRSGSISSYAQIMQEIQDGSDKDEEEEYDERYNDDIHEDVKYVSSSSSSGGDSLMVFTCTDHDTLHPLSPSSIIVAHNVEEAKRLLDRKLLAVKCKPYSGSKYTLKAVDMRKPQAIILNMGEMAQ